ncbi:di- and tricarboxylate transporters [Moorella thermoacetica Y72]|uniref:Sodium-dependent dicarboxylate transporter SdcS n=1 Tax=Moorella thermoacetica Y72 TaxID=1325331 RepID=A0A0S6UD13_NEOTH|nr:SLC13 family permease [Moorella thermoacetica]GAF26077.1 di- and tricarboxylate transporters [Moorella thermoacetica Y72]
MGKYKREIGFVLGLILLLIIWFMPTPAGLKVEGQRCLALSLMAVCWWAFGVAQSGFVALILLLGFVLGKVAPPEKVFSLWTSPLIYLVIGGYLIAAAVQTSGLGRRIALNFILRFANSYTNVIISAYFIGVLLSLLIPHPFPRAFLLMSVMAFVIKEAKLPPKDAASIGLAVFAGSAANSMVLLTGDSILNVAAVGFSGQTLSWLGWLLYMGIPGILATIVMCITHLLVFKPSTTFELEKDKIKEQLRAMGPMNINEKRTLFWIIVAICLWATDSLHHIHPGWVAMGIAGILSLPRLGDVLKPADWGQVNMGVLFFLTSALAIGTVGGYSGMNQWIASVILPAHPPTNPFVFGLLVVVVTIAIHMILGSALAVMGIVAPALVGYAVTAGWNPLVPALLVYTCVGIHWILPFHLMNILVGVGEAGGGYGDAEVVRLGLPLTVGVIIIAMFEIVWWQIVGLM